MLKGFGKLIAVIVAGLFVVATSLSLLLLAFETQLLKPDFYLGVLEDQEIYDRLPGIAAEQLSFDPCVENPDNCEADGQRLTGSSAGYFQVLTTSDWELLLSGLLPPDWLRGQVQSIIEQVLDYLETGAGELSITLSMQELKDRLSGEAGVDAIDGLLQDQPSCSNEDLIEMTRVLQGDEGTGKDFLNCNPPAGFIEERAPQLEVMLRRSLREIPDDVNLSSGLFGGTSETSGESPDVMVLGYPFTGFMLLQWIRWAIRMSPLFSLLLLLTIAFFAAGSFRDLSKWWGLPLIITGLIGLVIAFAATPVSDLLIDTFIARQSVAGISPSLFDVGTGLIGQVIRSLFVRVRILALILAVLGLAAMFAPRLFGTSRKIDETAPLEP
jgi:hypothetical protein